MSATFCCVQCRLLQAPTTTCVECAAPMTAPVELVRELLYYRDMRFGHHRDWGMLSAFLAGSSLALPILAPFAVGSIIALGIQTIRARRRRPQIVGIELQAAVPVVGARTLYGIARRFRSTIPSIVDDAPVLVEHAVIRDAAGAVLLRRSEAAPFLLELEDGAPVLVTGVARIATTNVLSRRLQVGQGDPRLARMGVPSDLVVSGALEVSTVVCDGADLAVTGLIEEEAIVELAFHRDGGRTPVMRGLVGAPVLVEDRRLVGAALCRSS